MIPHFRSAFGVILLSKVVAVFHVSGLQGATTEHYRIVLDTQPVTHVELPLREADAFTEAFTTYLSRK